MAVFNVKEKNKLWAIETLQAMSVKLGRLPKKADFDELTRSRIKSFLGPWPRALEVAGLKEVKADKSDKSNKN